MMKRGGTTRGILQAAIRGYQALRAGRPSPCRHIPSCSAYALEALEVHGTRHGSRLALGRLLRCRPGGSHGYDPVPPPLSQVRGADALGGSPA
jgi:putative membrane protein insertion efficiency factor